MDGYFLPFFYKGFYLRLFFNLNLNYTDQDFNYNGFLINLLTKKILFNVLNFTLKKSYDVKFNYNYKHFIFLMKLLFDLSNF